MNAVKRQLKLAVITADSDEAQALLDASNTIAQVEDSYWDLVAAWRNVAIQEEALQQAVEQQRSAVRLARRGGAPPITAVEAGNASCEFSVAGLLRAANGLAASESAQGPDRRRPGDPIWRANWCRRRRCRNCPAPRISPRSSRWPQRYRPEVRQVIDQRRQADVDLRLREESGASAGGSCGAVHRATALPGILQPVPNFEANACELCLRSRVRRRRRSRKAT